MKTDAYTESFRIPAAFRPPRSPNAYVKRHLRLMPPRYYLESSPEERARVNGSIPGDGITAGEDM